MTQKANQTPVDSSCDPSVFVHGERVSSGLHFASPRLLLRQSHWVLLLHSCPPERLPPSCCQAAKWLTRSMLYTAVSCALKLQPAFEGYLATRKGHVPAGTGRGEDHFGSLLLLLSCERETVTLSTAETEYWRRPCANPGAETQRSPGDGRLLGLAHHI